MEINTTIALYAAGTIIIALIFSLLDKRFEWLRMGPLYREKIWPNFLMNLLVFAVIATAVYFLPL